MRYGIEEKYDAEDIIVLNDLTKQAYTVGTKSEDLLLKTFFFDMKNKIKNEQT